MNRYNNNLIRDNRVLARRYAGAFLNLYDQELTPSVRENMAAFRQFLSQHPSILLFLSLPAIHTDIKKNKITFLCEKFVLPNSFKKSIFLLLSHNRIFLLEFFLKALNTLYNKKHAITTCVISSSHPLSSVEKKITHQFLIRHLNNTTINCAYTIDTTLIAGIRMLSDTYIWEYSIAQQLRSLQLLVARLYS